MTPDPIKDHLFAAYRKILKPLVGILLKAGVRFDEFVELAKGVYVESAVQYGVAGSSNPTRPRISVATGVPARDVDRFIDDPDALPRANATLAGVVTEILQLWHTEPEFSGPYGLPLELGFESEDGRGFVDLVKLSGTRVSAGVLMQQLVSSGAVVQTAENTFKATSRYFMFQGELSPQKLEYIGKVLARLANTLRHNSDTSNEAKIMERSVIADRGLPPETLLEFQKYARIKADEFLVDLDNWLSPHSKPGVRDSFEFDTGVHVFNFVENREIDNSKKKATSGSPFD